MVFWQRIVDILSFFKSFCSLVNFVTLGFDSAVAFFCLVITIFYSFDVTSFSSEVTIGAIPVATAGALI